MTVIQQVCSLCGIIKDGWLTCPSSKPVDRSCFWISTRHFLYFRPNPDPTALDMVALPPAIRAILDAGLRLIRSRIAKPFLSAKQTSQSGPTHRLTAHSLVRNASGVGSLPMSCLVAPARRRTDSGLNASRSRSRRPSRPSSDIILKSISAAHEAKSQRSPLTLLVVATGIAKTRPYRKVATEVHPHASIVLTQERYDERPTQWQLKNTPRIRTARWEWRMKRVSSWLLCWSASYRQVSLLLLLVFF